MQKTAFPFFHCLKYGKFLKPNPRLCFQINRSASTADPIMPSCDFQPLKYDLQAYDSMLATRKTHMNPAITTIYSKPLLIHQGHMQYLWDDKGKQYLDLFAGIVTVSVGHCHPKVTEAAKQQLDRLWHTTNIYMHPNVHQYADKLAAKMPGNLKVVYLVNSGSEANDLALLMARLHTNRYEILSLRNSYHGASPSLMGVTSHSTWRYPLPTGFGSVNVINPDPYRGVWGGANCRDSSVQTDRKCDCSPEECQASQNYLDQLEDTLRFNCPKAGVAAFIAESIQGVGGTVQFPRGYLAKAYEMVRAAGGVCIADEVQTGFGRTGTNFWGFEGHGVQPDIVTMAKGIGNGFPMAAVVTTPEIAANMTKALHFNTFGGNPVAGAVGTAVLDVIEESRMQEACVNLGDKFINGLAQLKEKHYLIGDVRGKGLMLGVEMVEDKVTKGPLKPERMMRIWESMRDHGVLVGRGGFYGNVFRIKPPMCISAADVEFALEVMDLALSNECRH